MAPAPPLRHVSLPPGNEFRFELEPSETISITLLQGTAEVFGFELVVGQPHPFSDEVRAAVWTQGGCELEMSPISPLLVSGGRYRVVEDRVASEAERRRTSEQQLERRKPSQAAVQYTLFSLSARSIGHLELLLIYSCCQTTTLHVLDPIKARARRSSTRQAIRRPVKLTYRFALSTSQEDTKHPTSHQSHHCLPTSPSTSPSPVSASSLAHPLTPLPPASKT